MGRKTLCVAVRRERREVHFYTFPPAFWEGRFSQTGCGVGANFSFFFVIVVFVGGGGVLWRPLCSDFPTTVLRPSPAVLWIKFATHAGPPFFRVFQQTIAPLLTHSFLFSFPSPFFGCFASHLVNSVSGKWRTGPNPPRSNRCDILSTWRVTLGER